MTPVAFSDEARHDLREARDFYLAINAALAARFAAEVEQAVRLIAEHPAAWTSMGRGRRRIVLKRFPFALVYRDTATPLRVIAVAHTRRSGRFWRGRS